MTVTTHKDADGVVIALEGELNTLAAPAFEEAVTRELENTTHLVVDMEKLTYITSAGLRILLMAQQGMDDKEGTLVIRHVNAEVSEVFNVTGFSGILTVEA